MFERCSKPRKKILKLYLAQLVSFANKIWKIDK